MESNDIARLYADAAKNLSRSWLEAGSAMFAVNRRLADAARHSRLRRSYRRHRLRPARRPRPVSDADVAELRLEP